MLTTREAADRLNIKPRSVAKLIKRGLLAATMRGRDYFIDESEIERYQRERRPAHRPKRSNTMTAADLLNAYREYAAATAAWEQHFDLANILDLPSAPEQSIPAKAGEIIHRRGNIDAALVEAQWGIEDPDCSEQLREVYQLVIGAAR
jgi:excisionase family DNA binding protein